jgi:hypothetical protein
VGRGTRLHPEKEDCLILDFVDLSELSLCSLPSLFGAPSQLDLQGNDAAEAGRVWQRIQFDHPGFELEAGSFTLPEIQRRAASFDPVTLQTHDDVRAITDNAWFSLGRFGLGLHFQRANGQHSEALVLLRATRGKKWEVSLDGKIKAQFSSAEAAIDAVDYEIGQFGQRAALSARRDASWRKQSAASLALPGIHDDLSAEDALRLAVWNRVVGRPPLGGS